MPRTLGAITVAMLKAGVLPKFYFLKQVWPSPTGTLRWTNYPNLANGGLDTVRENVDGADQDWDATKVWKAGKISQSQQTSLGVSDISLGNLDRAITDRERLHDGFANCKLTLWAALYDPATLGGPNGPDYTDAVQIFEGEGERAEAGDWVRLSLIPFRHVMLSPFPRRQYTKEFGFPWIPAPDFQVAWGGSNRTIPQRTAPRNPGNDPGTGTIEVPGRIGIPTRFPIVDPTGRRTTRTVTRDSTGPTATTPTGPGRGGTRNVGR